jgi:two-component system sensor histidine kinase TctE
VPREAQPLVDAINGLLARLGSALAAHRRFVANAAHQLRTPLAGLHTQAELALRETEPGAVRRSLEQLHQAAGRAAHLVSQLMALARLEPRSGRPLQGELLDLNGLARAATSRWVPQALARGIDLGFEASPTPVRLLGDRLLLEELLGNLIDNAVRYTPAGGQATVRVENGSSAVLSVEDNGPGIPEAERPQMLERFERGSSAGQSEGSGLGLAIVREIASTHGADVRLEAGRDGSGTCVRITFPAAG